MEEFPKTDLNKLILRRLEDVGAIHSHLSEILHLDLFNNLSKHNAYWHPEDMMSQDDKLDSIRRQLSCLYDDLVTILDIIEKE